MNDVHKMEQEKNVLRWGGLAGILGGILFVLGWVIVGMGPVGMDDPADLAGWVTRFPDIQAARVVENLEYLAALLLAVLFYPCLVSGSPEDAPRARSLWVRLGHSGPGLDGGQFHPARRARPALRTLSRSRGDPRGPGGAGSHVAGDPGYL